MLNLSDKQQSGTRIWPRIRVPATADIKALFKGVHSQIVLFEIFALQYILISWCINKCLGVPSGLRGIVYSIVVTKKYSQSDMLSQMHTAVCFTILRGPLLYTAETVGLILSTRFRPALLYASS